MGYKGFSGVTNVGAIVQAYVADWEGRCVVDFEGTHDLRHWSRTPNCTSRAPLGRRAAIARPTLASSA